MQTIHQYSENTITNENLSRLPSIGHPNFNDPLKNRIFSLENAPSKTQTPLKIIKGENAKRMNMTKQKRSFHSNQKKSNANSKPKTVEIDETHNKILHQNKEQQDHIETSILEIPPSSIKNYPNNFSSAYNFKNFQSQNFFEFFEQRRKRQHIPVFVDASVQTDNCEISKDAYEEFIKFRITEREKFEKLKSLFQYIENLAHLESENFEENKREFNSLLKLKDSTKQDQRVAKLLTELDRKFHNFNDMFREVFKSERDNLKEFQRVHMNFLSFTKTLIKDVEWKINNLQSQNAELVSLLSYREVFKQAYNSHENFSNQHNTLFNEKVEALSKNYKDLEEKYFEWSRNTYEQSKLIKTCIMTILELPQLSIGLFGADRSFDHIETNQEIKDYNLNDKLIPHIVDFFMRRDHPDAKELNEIFMKCCEANCMNCIYMRTKLRFIYDKNNELKPIVKKLVSLVDNGTVKNQFEKLAIHKTASLTSRKHI